MKEAAAPVNQHLRLVRSEAVLVLVIEACGST